MPMLWIIWFVSFAIAVALATWMRTLGFGWAVSLVLPFIISQVSAAFILGGIHRRLQQIPPDGLADAVSAAIEALPPDATEDEKVEVGKRVIDEAFRSKR